MVYLAFLSNHHLLGIAVSINHDVQAMLERLAMHAGWTGDALRPAAGSMDSGDAGNLTEVSYTAFGQEELLHTAAYFFEPDNVITLCCYLEV